LLVNRVFLFVFLSFRFHVRAQSAVEDEVAANIDSLLLDWLVTYHSCYDVTLNRAFRLIFVICIDKLIMLFVPPTIFYTVVATPTFKHHVFAAVTERVSVYFL